MPASVNDNTVNPSGKMQKISLHEIALPKGGGAMRSIGDNYKANLFSGTGSYSIPVAVTPARGFEPELNLSYSSGGGNSEFGLGFSLSLSSVSINTERRIPRYDGTDVFMLSGEGELVLKNTAGESNPHTVNVDGESYEVSVYLPRIEQAYSRIEQWKKTGSRECYWKVTSRENVVSYFGRTPAARIYNPADSSQVFEWLIDESIDAKGNRIVYTYKEENGEGVPKEVYEDNRSYTAQRYIHSIEYGNYVKPNGDGETFAFSVIFDYGEYNISNPITAWTPAQIWNCRPDPFSSYRSGFEIRTFRLCRNILLFHSFEKELGAPFLVKANTLGYDNKESYDPVRFDSMSKIKKAGLSAFRKSSDTTFEKQDFPPLEFNWSEFNAPQRPEFKTLTSGGYSIPGMIGPGQFFPVDLNGEGIPGLLYTDGQSVMYLEPEGNGQYKAPENLSEFPVNRSVDGGAVSIQDIDGNGEMELVVTDENLKGFYALEDGNSWQHFQPFNSYPTNYANQRMENADLGGNGKSDLLLIGNEEIHIYNSEGKNGYEKIRTVMNGNNIPINPLGDPTVYIGFANLFGDGMSHRVRVSNRSVQCWPSLGYGNFGEVVTLSNPPDFGEDFNVTRVFFSDLDGSGTADLIYVYSDRIEVYLNQSGNSFSEPVSIYLPAPFSTLDQINFADILGNGTSCLVFTKMTPAPVQYWYNFAGESEASGGKWVESMKPYLLCEIDNHLGTTTTIRYSSSSRYALEDKRMGRPWPGTLPFPVQVVEEISTYDKISEMRSVSRYAWHDGYYDPEQRAFRGFGYVESWDSESEEAGKESFSSVPPVYTRSWYLTGAFADYDALLKHYKTDYFSKDKKALNFPESYFDPAVFRNGDATLRQAYASLRDRLIRREVYGLDGSVVEEYPYTVEESNYTVVLIQAAEEHPYGVFRIDSRESIKYNYERNPDDPNTSQQFTLEVDPLCGEVKKSCTVFLSRRKILPPSAIVYPEQKELKATGKTTLYINTDPNIESWYRGVSYDEQEFQLFDLNLNGAEYFSYAQISQQAGLCFQNVVPYMGKPLNGLAGPYASQLNWATSYFWNEDQSDALEEGKISSRALLHHLSQEVYTKDNIRMVYGDRLTEDVIIKHGGYTYNDARGYYENRGLVQHYYKDVPTFFMPWKVENSFVDASSEVYRQTTLEYDSYFLAAVKSRQYLDDSTENVISAEIDYQVMLPKQLIDINNNVSQALYDPFGKVIASSLFGKEEAKAIGAMRLYEYDGMPAEYIRRTTTSDGQPITFDDVINNQEYYLQGAGLFFFYDLNAYERSIVIPSESPQPLSSISLKRYNYYHLNGTTTPFSSQTEIEFSDGSGKIIEKKMAVEPGLSIARNVQGNLLRSKGKIIQSETENRWLVSGRTVYNNKGLTAEQYLAYFSNTPHYETQKEITEEGIVPPPSRFYYDPLQRVVRTDTPKGFFTKVEYSAWEEAHFDEDDTVLDSEYYIKFMANYPPDPTPAEKDEKDALDKAALFYNTPTIHVIDNSNSGIRDIQTQADKTQLVTFTEEDIQGRKIRLIDPRLYKSNLDKGTEYYSFKYLYPMGADSYASSDSADAGRERFFNNIYSGLCWSISARNYCQLLIYDKLDRKSRLNIKLIEESGPIIDYSDFNLVEIFTYGESQPDADLANLRGQLFKLQDLSGTSVTPQYSMRGNALKNSRQMVKDYKTPANWKKNVELEGKYDFSFTFDALGDLLTEVTPDGSTTAFSYNIAGLLNRIKVTGKDNFEQLIVSDITYDANRQRQKINYGNGIQTSYTYEWTTQRLIRLFSTQFPANTIVQDINYTYDPVGNLTRSRDYSIDTVFYRNQQVDPKSDYTYDAIYRLKIANGRQHPGINGSTYKNNASEGSFKQSIFSKLPPPSDGTALENYIEIYTYDDSGNLIHKQHIADSVTFPVDAPVEDNNNHLKGVEYDACGNQRQIAINNTVSLSFNCCENLIRAGIIERPDEPDDCDYYVYDNAEVRTCKVSERMVNGNVVEVSRKTYVGNYEIKQNYTVANGVSTLTLERQTLRVMDDQTCVTVIHYWVTDTQKREVNKTGERSIRFQMGNSDGSVSMEMDRDGLLISYEEYFPFGGTAIIAGASEIEVALKDYRYSGKECDDSTGLYYFGARYFISWSGRWLNADPVGDKDGLNLYTYVANNPLAYHDPDGLSKKRKTRDWEPDDSKVRKKVRQSQLDGPGARGRKSWYPTGIKAVTPAIRKSYVTSTTGVVAILKINGVAVQTGKNGPAFESLSFPEIGTVNQKGLKINPHAEDWNLSSFRIAYALSSKSLGGFLTSSGVPSETGNTGDVKGKHVFSLRINFSPCLGCVGTILSFKEFLDTELGSGNFILRTKFLRPYDLPKTLTSETSTKAESFSRAIDLLEGAGIYVRIQPVSSAQKMTPTLKLSGTDFGQEVINTLFPDKYKELTKTWKTLGVSRTK